MTRDTTTAALSTQSISFDEFLEMLGVPSSCELNKPIFKKMFSEATDGKKAILDAADKKALKDDVEKIRHALKSIEFSKTAEIIYVVYEIFVNS